MKITRNTLRAGGWAVFTCFGLGALPGILQAIFGKISLHEFLHSGLEGAIFTACIMTPCCLAIPRALAALDTKPVGWRIAVSVGILTVFSFSGSLVAVLIFVATGMLQMGLLWAVWWQSLRVCLLITFTFGLLSTAFLTLRTRLEAAKTELHRQQMAEERERKMAAEARFASLESRVHPHFLFNTLNSIAALVRENPAEAERMIERLSALLRYSLDSEIAGLVPLRDELRIVREYLEIEQVRFGARLRYRIEAEENVGDRVVPALSIQTLVENSVKYAVGTSRDGAEILFVRTTLKIVDLSES